MAVKNGVQGQEAPALAPSTAPPIISWDQTGRALPVLIGYAVSYAVGKGWLTTADAPVVIDFLEQLAVPLLAAAHVVWIFYNNRKAAKVAQVQAMPDMQVVTTSAAIKAEIPDVLKVPPTKTVVVSPKN